MTTGAFRPTGAPESSGGAAGSSPVCGVCRRFGPAVPMSVSIGAEVVFGAGYLVGSVLWPRLYYGRLDPVVRRWLGDHLGVQIVWAVRQGGFHRGPLWFGPLYDTWCWCIEGGERRTIIQEVVVNAAWLLLVPVICGLWPVAVFLSAFLIADVLSILIAYPLLFLNIPIYTRYWGGKYEVPGMQPTLRAKHTGAL